MSYLGIKECKKMGTELIIPSGEKTKNNFPMKDQWLIKEYCRIGMLHY